MALLHCDSFKLYPTGTSVETRTIYPGYDPLINYDNNAGIKSNWGALPVCQVRAANPIGKSYPAKGKIGLGFRYCAQTAYGDKQRLRFYDNGVVQCHAKFRPDTGEIIMYKGDTEAAGDVLFDVFTAIRLMARHYLEFWIDPAAGIATLRVDGIQVGTVSGAAINPSTRGTTDKWYLDYPQGGEWFFIEDLWLIDDSGSVANSLLGDCRVYPLKPSTDSAAGFTRSTGASNASCVDDQPHNGDADYNQATAADTIDRFNMETLPAELTGPIYGLRPLAMAKKTDAGTGSLSTLVVAGGVDYLQTETGLGTSYQPVAPDILTINPNTGAAWTSGQINAPLVAGYKRVQ